MTKPLPYSCTKKMTKIPTLSEFNAVLNSLSRADKIGHLFIMDITFHNKNDKMMLFNEIYTPIFEKNKINQTHKRSALQLMSVLNRKEDKDIINNFKSNSKTHSTVGDKKYTPLYAEHIHFLVTRAGWLVTKIYQHFTFEQTKFKQDFVVTNQKARQKATSPVELDFYKLLNNANFGNYCRNNIDNCSFEPIYDKISEIAYIKKFDSIFDNEKYRDYSDGNLMTQEVNEKYDQLIFDLDKIDTTYEPREYSLGSRKGKDLNSINSMAAHKKRIRKKELFMRLKKK